MGRYPICIAKTRCSFSADPKGYDDMRDFDMEIGDIVLNSGTEMTVVIMGSIMRTSGLPKEPQAVHMDIIDGRIEGLSQQATLHTEAIALISSSPSQS